MYFPERLFIYSLLAVSGRSTYKNTHVKNHKLVWPEIVDFMKASHTPEQTRWTNKSQSGSCMSISQGKDLNVFRHIWILHVCCYGQRAGFSSHTNLLNFSTPICFCICFSGRKKSEELVPARQG